MPTRHNTTTSGWSSAGSIASNKPTRSDGSALVDGDVLIAYLHITNSSAGHSVVTPPANQGWVLIDQQNNTGNAVSGAIAAYKKRITADDATRTSYTFGFTNLSAALVSITAFSDARVPDPADGSSKAVVQNSQANTVNITAPAITPTRNGDIIMAGSTWYAGNLTGAGTVAPPTETPAWTELYDVNSAALYTNRRVGELAVLAGPNANVSSGTKTFTVSQTPSGQAILMVAIASPTNFPHTQSFSSIMSMLTPTYKAVVLRVIAFILSMLLSTPVSKTVSQRIHNFVQSMQFLPVKKTFLLTKLFQVNALLTFEKMNARVLAFTVNATFTARKQINKEIRFSMSMLTHMVKSVTKSLSFSVAMTFSPTKIFFRTIQFISTMSFVADGVRQIVKTTFRNVAKRLAGRSGPIQIRYTIWLSDQYANKIKPIKHVREADVEMSNYRDDAWYLTLKVKASDEWSPITDYVHVTAEVRMAEEEWYEFPLGLYRFEANTGTMYEHSTMWDLKGHSVEWMLSTDGPEETHLVAKNSKILATVRQILNNKAGIPNDRILLPTKDKTLTVDMVWNPGQDAEGSSWLRICNSLLEAGGFYALQADAKGRFVTTDIVDLDYKPVDVQYGPDDEAMVLPGGTDEWDFTAFANKVVVISQDPNITPPITAVAVNRSANSPASTVNFGRIVTKYVAMQAVNSQADADKIARETLQRSSSYHRKVIITTLPDPRRGLREVYVVNIANDLGPLLEGKWHVTNWKIPLSTPPKEMTHEITKLERLEDITES